jgi:hypothetical protein
MVWRTADRNLKILQPSPHFPMVREIAEAYTAHTPKNQGEIEYERDSPREKIGVALVIPSFLYHTIYSRVSGFVFNLSPHQDEIKHVRMPDILEHWRHRDADVRLIQEN